MAALCTHEHIHASLPEAWECNSEHDAEQARLAFLRSRRQQEGVVRPRMAGVAFPRPTPPAVVAAGRRAGFGGHRNPVGLLHAPRPGSGRRQGISARCVAALLLVVVLCLTYAGRFAARVADVVAR